MSQTYPWLRLSPPWPPDELLRIAAITPGGRGQLGDSHQIELHRNRGSALRTLGSRTLRAVVSRILYTKYSIIHDGDLSRILKEVESPSSSFDTFLSEKVIEEPHLIKGYSEDNTLDQARKRAVGALFILLGAYSLTGMMKELEVKLLPYIGDGLKHLLPSLGRGTVDLTDWKTALQEITQRKTRSSPVYKLLDMLGSDNAKSFVVSVSAPGLGIGRGTGRSKKQAEQEAARDVVLPLLKRNPNLLRLTTSTTKVRSANSKVPEQIEVYVKQRTIPEGTLINSLCGNRKLIHQALTHRSFSGEFEIFHHFAGLPTLGAYVLDIYLGRQIMKTLWDSDDIELFSTFLSAFYRTRAIAQLYDIWELDQWVLLGAAQRKEGATIQMKESFVQALAGACYIDAEDLETALTRWHDRAGAHFSAHMDQIGVRSDAKSGSQSVTHPSDPKTLLQEVTQIIRLQPEYKLWREVSPGPQRKFQSAIRVVLPEPYKPSPWLIGLSAATHSAGDQQAADFYLRLMRVCIREGEKAAPRLFREQSRAVAELVAQAATIAALINVQANIKQLKNLRRAGLCLLHHDSLDFDKIVTLLTQVDNFISVEKILSPSRVEESFIFTYLTSPQHTGAELQNLLGALSDYLASVEPETWDEKASARQELMERLIHVPSLLKNLSDIEEVVDLKTECSQVTKEYGAAWIEPPSPEKSLTIASAGFLNWLLWEILELLDGECDAISISSVNHTIKFQCEKRDGLFVDPPPTFTNLLACKDALLFGAGVKSILVDKTSIELHFVNNLNGPLVKLFLQEGRKRLYQGKEFGPVLHDIKNALVAINILSERIKTDTAQRYRYLADIEEKLQAVRGQVSSLKLMSESLRKPTLQLTTISHFVNQYRLRALALLPGSIDFSTSGDQKFGKAELDVDENLLGYALDNIVKNAREAISDSGGVIKLEWLVDEDNAVCLLSISDNGPGMSEEVLEKVRTEGFSSKRVTGGTGLGLRSARQIVESHGGELTISSQVEKGTKVDIELPLVEASAQERESLLESPLETAE